MTEGGLGSGHCRVPCSKGTGGVRRRQKSGRRWWQTKPGRDCACVRQPATVRPRTTARVWERQQSAPSAWERRGPLAPASSASNLQATLSPVARALQALRSCPALPWLPAGEAKQDLSHFPTSPGSWSWMQSGPVLTGGTGEPLQSIKGHFRKSLWPVVSLQTSVVSVPVGAP
nr:uncharacterized protein LOC105480187 [Macaca nemestrina]